MCGGDFDVDDVQTSGGEAEDDAVEREEIDSNDEEHMNASSDNNNSP